MDYGPSLGVVDLRRADARFLGPAEGAQLGVSAHVVPDRNADGFDEIMVGAWTDATGGPARGAPGCLGAAGSDRAARGGCNFP